MSSHIQVYKPCSLFYEELQVNSHCSITRTQSIHLLLNFIIPAIACRTTMYLDILDCLSYYDVDRVHDFVITLCQGSHLLITWVENMLCNLCLDDLDSGEDQQAVKVPRPKSAIQKAVEDKLHQLSQLQLKSKEADDEERDEPDDEDDAHCIQHFFVTLN